MTGVCSAIINCALGCTFQHGSPSYGFKMPGVESVRYNYECRSEEEEKPGICCVRGGLQYFMDGIEVQCTPCNSFKAE